MTVEARDLPMHRMTTRGNRVRIQRSVRPGHFKVSTSSGWCDLKVSLGLALALADVYALAHGGKWANEWQPGRGA